VIAMTERSALQKKERASKEEVNCNLNPTPYTLLHAGS
jgi:hypothetical protein